MRPDPYKQKASRRYQATHRAASPARSAASNHGDTTENARHSRGKESEDDSPLETTGAIEAKEEEDIIDFLNYLKEESHTSSAEQSAVYFQLRTEAESAELAAYNEGMWQKLLSISWGESLNTAVSSCTLPVLLDSDCNFVPNTEPMQERDYSAAQLPQISHVSIARNVVELAPSIKPPSMLPGIPTAAAKKADTTRRMERPVDDLEAFLDDLL